MLKDATYSQAAARSREMLTAKGDRFRRIEGSIDCYGVPTPVAVANVVQHTDMRMPGEVVANAKVVGIDVSGAVARVTGLK